jgi:asparagine synthase (glutamine-hydrolysing)
MCGITGIVDFSNSNSVDPDLLRKMGSVISHRGPDDEGYYFDHRYNVGFAHRRLSIIDLETGKQPMSNADGTIWITYNGEIYNFVELKEELQLKGYQFKTKSDTEVIIYLYEEYGISAFKRLNGIFAFALHDKRDNSVILVRDPFGVKPLYHYYDNDLLLFGSEIKTILKYPGIQRELDYTSFNSFLTFRYNPSPQTLFKGINKLIPGSFLKINSNRKIILDSYLDHKPITDHSISEIDAIEEYQRLLEKSVKRQIISDVPVGVLLSGGVDSAIIASLMQKETKDNIKTFTIGFEGKGDFNELDDAKSTAELLNTDHYDLIITKQEYMDFFFKSFFYLEEPIAESTIPALFHVSKLASNHLKVVLAGQGADEPLGGYHRHIGEKYINKLGFLMRCLPLESIASLIPRNEKFKRAVYTSRFSDELNRFLALYTIFTPEQKDILLNDDTKQKLTDVNKTIVERLYTQTDELDDSLAKLFYIDTRLSLSDNLLLFGDKITMANGLEMRVPFLDIDLINFLETLPSSFKLRGITRKYIHKKAVEKWLPKSIIYRKKRGFQTPMDNWLQNDLAPIAKNYLCSNNSISCNFFNVKEISKMIDMHQQKKANYQRSLFSLLSFEMWYREFF